MMTSLNRNPVSDSRSDVLVVTETLLSQAQKSGNIDPRAHTCCAQAAANAALAALGQGDGITAASLFDRIGLHFDDAEQLANANVDPDDRNDWLMHTLTWRIQTMREYNSMAVRHAKRKRVKPRFFSKEEIDECGAKIEEIFERDAQSGIFPNVSWHNYQGDRSPDDEKAAQYYRQAIVVQPYFLESYLKAFATVDGEQQRAILSGNPSSEFWTNNARRALDWYKTNRQGIDRNTSLPALAKRRLAEGAERMQKRLRMRT